MTSRTKKITDYRSLGGELSHNKLEYIFPIISSVGKNDQQYNWRIKVSVVTLEPANAESTTSPIYKYHEIQDEWFDNEDLPIGMYGYFIVDKWIGDGEIHAVEPTVLMNGKNLKRANHTTAFTQALSDAYSLMLKQNDRNGNEKTIDGVVVYPPMLAQKLENHLDKIKLYECFQQRKYDGVRSVMTLNKARDNIIIYSRQMKPYNLFDYLRESIRDFIITLENTVGEGSPIKIHIDGELYKDGVKLQDISGMARKALAGTDQTIKLEYFIYDLFIPSLPNMKYSDRKHLIDSTFSNAPANTYPFIKMVETHAIENEDDMMARHNSWLQDGYEGSIVRTNSEYVHSYKSYHSANLLKIKPRHDAEFKLVGFGKSIRGKTSGCLIWECETDAGRRFNVTPMGTLDDRRNLYLYMNDSIPNSNSSSTSTSTSTQEGDVTQRFEKEYLGRMITVSFDDYSKDGVPVRASAIDFRDYE